MKIYTNDLVKGHSDLKVKCLTFGLYTQVSDSGPLGPLVSFIMPHIAIYHQNLCRAPEWERFGVGLWGWNG